MHIFAFTNNQNKLLTHKHATALCLLLLISSVSSAALSANPPPSTSIPSSKSSSALPGKAPGSQVPSNPVPRSGFTPVRPAGTSLPQTGGGPIMPDTGITPGDLNTQIPSPITPSTNSPTVPGVNSPSSNLDPIKSDQPQLRGIESNISLTSAFDEGLIRSPRTSAIRLLLGITKSEMVRATELPNPTLFMDNGYRAEFTYRYGLTIPIEQPWKLALRLVLAKNMIKQTDMEILKALWIFRANVRRAYTDLVVAQELYSTFSELVDLTNQLYGIAKKRFEAGEVAELDVYRAEQEAYKALAEQAQQQYRVLEARQVLAVILGRNPENNVEVPRLPTDGSMPPSAGILPGNNLPTLQVCLDKAMTNRPELKVLKQAIKTNGASLRLAYANILPNTTLGVGASNVNGPTQPSQNREAALQAIATDPASIEKKDRVNFHGFFFQVYQELPIFNVQQGDISKFNATDRQLKAELSGQENLVSSEVAAAYQRLSGAKRKIEIFQTKLLQRTLEIARLSRLGYEVGQSDINATLLAQQATIQIKTDYLTTLATYQQAYTDLEQSIGTVLQ